MSDSNEPNDTVIVPAVECKIKFSGLDNETTLLARGNPIVIHPSSGEQSISSSKVKLRTIVNYNWDERSYSGELLALHKSGKYIAYAIKVGKDGQGVVRVVDLVQNDRVLIKGLTGMAQYVSFAFLEYPIMVACIDEAGSIFINEIVVPTDQMLSLQCVLKARITSGGDAEIDPAHLLRWCPYSPEEGHENDMSEDFSLVFLAARKNKVEIWDVNAASAHGASQIKPGELKHGYTCIEPGTYFVTDMIMSPDGTTLAVTTNAGAVKFYQIQSREVNCLVTNCLHEWRPHDGKLLTCLFFLDNLGEPETSSFWKFAVTGAQNNRELKVWSCESWICLQTIKFISPVPSTLLSMKAYIDPTASVILLSDVTNRKLYALEIEKGKHAASVFRVSEFFIQSPVLSICMAETGVRYYTRDAPSSDNFYSSPDEIKAIEERDIKSCTMIKSYIIQPESLQQCDITFNDRSLYENVEATANNTIHDEYDNTNTTNGIIRYEDVYDMDEELTESEILIKENGHGEELENQTLMINEIEEKLMSASGSSSPSREVEDILSCSKASRTNKYPPELESWNTPTALNQAASLISPISLSPDIDSNIPTVAKKEVNELKRPIEDDNSTLIIMDDNNDAEITLLTDLANRQSKLEVLMESLNNKFDDLLKSKTTNDEITTKCIEMSVEKAINHSLLNNMQQIIHNEVKSTVLPVIKNDIDSFIEQVPKMINQQISLSQIEFSENVSKMLYSETFTDSLTNKLTPSLPNQIVEGFSRDFVPKMDKLYNNMFVQLNHTFSKGSETIISNIENNILTNIKNSLEHGAQVQTQSQQMVFKANTTLEGVKETISSTQEKTLKLLEGISNKLSNMQNNVTAPSPTVQFTKLDLIKLINSGDITIAVEKVLNSMDGKLLSLLVNKLPVEQVFDKQCKLEQRLVLSLIYQLASDLSSETDGRCRYMERAMTYVDPDHPASKQHLIKVMSYTKAKISNFLSTNPTGPKIHSLRLMLIVIDGLLTKKP